MSPQSSSSSASADEGSRRPNVEVVFPSEAAAAEFVDDGVTALIVSPDAPTVGSGNAAGDVSSLVAKALAELPPELAEQAKDPKRHARSKDPGWKYGFWPNEAKKEMVQCIFCKKIVPAGIKRFKQHLAGGYGDTEKCPKAPAIVRKEMHDYLVKNARVPVQLMEDNEESKDVEEGEVQKRAPVPVPSSGTKVKEAKRKAMAQASIGTQKNYQKSVNSMLCKSPEEIVEQRHKSTSYQPTLEHCTKKSKEAKQVVDDHVADFFYENGIPLNAINSRTWEILLESIGQYGPGYRSPSYHELRKPLLERAVEKTNDLKKKHEDAWKEYGCSLMSDSWTDQRQRHLINFLVNSPAGTFFLGSVDASSEVADANMLTNLLEKQIEIIGKEHVVQVVTDNGANYKRAGKNLMERIPTLFWTPCAAHCLDLLLEDLGKIKDFNTCISNAKKVCRFLYKHGRLLDQMRDKLGGDLVRPAVTRFATAFLTLASMYRHKNGLRSLFISDEWHANKLVTSEEGKNVERIVLSVPFWNQLENCLKASQPILIALRIADGDETPAAPEIMAAMETAKKTIKEALKDKPQLLKDVLGYFDRRWDYQMEGKLYGAALFLNPAKFFPIKENNRREAARLRSMFNDVLWKMVTDDDEQSKISKQADDYERAEGEAFSKELAIKDRNKKSPILWWGAYGGLAYELQTLAKRIVSLCCSASGCERNWSTFSQIHTKRRNRLEHTRLNKLVYVSYNRKMTNRFTKIRELGSKGKKCNPLLLEEFQWESEWVDAGFEPVHQSDAAGNEDLTWAHVDEATGASQGLSGRNLPRAAAARAKRTTNQPSLRKRKQPRHATAVLDEILEGEDEELQPEDQDTRQPQVEEENVESDGTDAMDEDFDGSESTGGGGGCAAAGAFHVDDALL